MIDVYVYSAANRTNIWAAVGARCWAVSIDHASLASIQRRARNLPIGALGIFYCVEENGLTTPFLVRTRPNLESVGMMTVWPERGEWDGAFPFGIVPLGTPHKLLKVGVLRALLPSLRDETKKWDELFHVSPFAASSIWEDDWAAMISVLAEP